MPSLLRYLIRNSTLSLVNSYYTIHIMGQVVVRSPSGHGQGKQLSISDLAIIAYILAEEETNEHLRLRRKRHLGPSNHCQ